MKSSIFVFYLTEIPRLRRVEDWPDLVKILERSQTNQRKQNHKTTKQIKIKVKSIRTHTYTYSIRECRGVRGRTVLWRTELGHGETREWSRGAARRASDSSDGRVRPEGRRWSLRLRSPPDPALTASSWCTLRSLTLSLFLSLYPSSSPNPLSLSLPPLSLAHSLYRFPLSVLVGFLNYFLNFLLVRVFAKRRSLWKWVIVKMGRDLNEQGWIFNI